MLNIKIKSNYKSIVDKIIEKINIEFETYNIYNEDSRNKDINELNPDGSRDDNESVLDFISNEQMKKRINNRFKFEGDEEYYYASVPFSKDLINSLNRMSDIEYSLVERELKKEGLKIAKIKQADFLIIGLDKKEIK